MKKENRTHTKQSKLSYFASYMGAEFKDSGIVFPSGDFYGCLEDLKYDSSWDFLVPVAQKVKQDVEPENEFLSAWVTWSYIGTVLVHSTVEKCFEDLFNYIRWRLEDYDN